MREAFSTIDQHVFGRQLITPALFGGRNDIPAYYNVSSVICLLAFVSIFLAFLVFIICTSRKRRTSTILLSGVIFLNIIAIDDGLKNTNWYLGTVMAESSYCMYTPGMKIYSDLELKLGLYSFNITFQESDAEEHKDAPVLFDNETYPRFGFYYNEAFDFNYNRPNQPQNFKLQALRRGLPNPITIIAEYMDTEGSSSFGWGRKFEMTGYYTGAMVIASAIILAFNIAMLVTIPAKGGECFVLTGISFIITASVYKFTIGSSDIRPIYVEGGIMAFQVGEAVVVFYVLGVVNLIIGVVSVLLHSNNRTFSTFFELNYGTPWENKIIGADSKNRREKSLLQRLTRKDDGDEHEVFFTTKHLYVASRIRASMRSFRKSFKSKSRPHSENVLESCEAFEGIQINDESGSVKRSSSELNLSGDRIFYEGQHSKCSSAEKHTYRRFGDTYLDEPQFRPRSKSEMSFLDQKSVFEQITIEVPKLNSTAHLPKPSQEVQEMKTFSPSSKINDTSNSFNLKRERNFSTPNLEKKRPKLLDEEEPIY